MPIPPETHARLHDALARARAATNSLRTLLERCPAAYGSAAHEARSADAFLGNLGERLAVQRTREGVTVAPVADELLAALTAAGFAPLDEETTAGAVRRFAASREEQARDASHYAELAQDAHDALDAAGVPHLPTGDTPAARVRAATHVAVAAAPAAPPARRKRA